MRQAVAEGLDKVDKLKPGGGYAEAAVGVSRSDGPFALVEAGWKPRHNLSIFGTGRWSPIDAYAGVGARLVW